MKLRGKQVVVVGNGHFTPQLKIKPAYDDNIFLVAVNGGTKHIIKQNLIPDLIIGDLDSLSPLVRKKTKQHNVPVITYPKDKDFTDLELAINFLLQYKPKNITLLGLLGKRWDQTLANFCIMESCLNHGIKCRMIDGSTTIWLINSSIAFKTSIGDTVSLHPLTNKVQGITTKGLKFYLKDDTLLRTASRGISNIAIRASVEISVRSGTLFVFHIQKKKTHSPIVYLGAV